MALGTRARRRCSAFVIANTLLDRRIARAGSEVSAFALLAGVTLEGIPENMALGVSLLEVASESGAAIALLVAIFASNLPEDLGGGSVCVVKAALGPSLSASGRLPVCC